MEFDDTNKSQFVEIGKFEFVWGDIIWRNRH